MPTRFVPASRVITIHRHEIFIRSNDLYGLTLMPLVLVRVNCMHHTMIGQALTASCSKASGKVCKAGIR